MFKPFWMLLLFLASSHLRLHCDSPPLQVELCRECIQWATEQSRAYLRQTLQARLVRLLNDLQRYTAALPTGGRLFAFVVSLRHSWSSWHRDDDGRRRIYEIFAAAELIKELKKVDDKDLLVEVQLEESKSFYYLGNLGRWDLTFIGDQYFQ